MYYQEILKSPSQNHELVHKKTRACNTKNCPQVHFQFKKLPIRNGSINYKEILTSPSQMQKLIHKRRGKNATASIQVNPS